MLILIKFTSKKLLFIENDERTREESVEIRTKWKFYPKQIQTFSEALSRRSFHHNFVQNVENYLFSTLNNRSPCDNKIILIAGYQRVPDFIDIAWCRRIIVLIRARTEVEEALALLSTIGGAYSCLGERDASCAEKAGMVAMRQLKLSTVRGDPNLVTRCFIYRVYSLCQRGDKKEAVRTMKQIIHPLLTKMMFNNCCDEAVKNMYRAASHRIRYLTISNKG